MIGKRFRPGVLSLLVLLFSGPQAGAADEREAAALEAAQAWLALVDAASYAESWETASAYFQNAISKAQWEHTLDAVRRPLGAMVSRTLQSSRFETELPGAPDGEYLVIQFETSFENKQAAVETVTPMRESDGVWKVTGYFIR